MTLPVPVYFSGQVWVHRSKRLGRHQAIAKSLRNQEYESEQKKALNAMHPVTQCTVGKYDKQWLLVYINILFSSREAAILTLPGPSRCLPSDPSKFNFTIYYVADQLSVRLLHCCSLRQLYHLLHLKGVVVYHHCYYFGKVYVCLTCRMLEPELCNSTVRVDAVLLL